MEISSINSAKARDVSHRVSQLIVWSGPVALGVTLLVVIGLILSALFRSDTPTLTREDINRQLSQTLRANAFVQDFMTLWLGGRQSANDTAMAETLERMYSLPGQRKIPLPAQPYQVQQVRAWPVDNGSFDIGGGEVYFRHQAEVRMVAPGAASVATHLFELDVVMNAQGTFAVNALPRQVARINTPFVIASPYEGVVDTGALKDSAQAFVSAYFTPSTGAGLGATVGPNFVGSPVTVPLWSQVSVEEVLFYSPDGVTPEMAKPGDTLHAIFVVRGSTSAETFSTLHVPVVMVMLDNMQWVVDSFDPTVEVGATAPR